MASLDINQPSEKIIQNAAPTNVATPKTFGIPIRRKKSSGGEAEQSGECEWNENLEADVQGGNQYRRNDEPLNENNARGCG
jgi:hypothetical protein